MEIITCYQCDEFTTKGQKQTGYCNREMKPTRKSVVKKCREEARNEVGDFCWYCCPFTDDNEGYLCDNCSPRVTDIHLCPELNSKLNDALGGYPEYSFLYINNQAEIVEKVCTLYHGVYDWVKNNLTLEWRWLCGWQRYYPEEKQC